MHAPNMITVLSLLPAAIFSAAMIVHFSARAPGRLLLAGPDPGGTVRISFELLLVITTAFLVMPAFRATGVVLASFAMIALATMMLIRSKFDYAIPALIALATLPLALPGPQ